MSKLDVVTGGICSKRSRPHRSKFVQGVKAPQELLDLDRNGDARYFWMFVVFYEAFVWKSQMTNGIKYCIYWDRLVMAPICVTTS